MEQEKIIKLAANKSAEEINYMYEHCKEQNDILIEAIRQNLSRILMDTNALLPEQNWSRRIQLHNEGKHQHGNCKNDQPNKGQNNIYKPLDYMPIHVCIPPR